MRLRLSLPNLLLATLMAVAAGWPAATAAHETITIITITDAGFAPSEATVDTQAVVNFVNQDATAHWPASDPHPIHDQYPAFDPTHAIEPGNFWMFRPTQPGTWKYHDHLFPHRRGVLRVVPDNDDGRVAGETAAPPAARGWIHEVWDRFARMLHTAKTRIWKTPALKHRTLSAADFRALPEREQYAHVDNVVKAQGLAATWTYVKDAYTSDAGASLGGRAHDLAHFLGGRIFKERGLAGLTLCDTTFAFGCYHGFAEAAFTGSLDRLPELASACEALGRKESGPWASCIHGIGHGVSTYYASNDLSAALGACDALAQGATFCHDGVFMEMSFSASPRFYRRDDVLYPCTAVEPRYQQACARNQPHVMQRLLGLDRQAVAAACATQPPAIADPCIDALGFAATNESQGNAEKIVAACENLPTPLLSAKCTTAAAGELVFQNFPNWRIVTRVVCDSLPPEFRPACNRRVQELATHYRR